MKNKIIFSDEQKTDVVDLYEKLHMSTRTIADKYNCSNSTIRRLLQSCNVQFRDRYNSAQKKIQISEYQVVSDMYNNGMTIYEIANSFNCSVGPVIKALKHMNVQMRPNGFTKEDALKMYNMYNDGLSLDKIASLYETDRHTVGRVLKRNELFIDRKTYHCNEHYFDSIDTPNKAYILGLLWSDGCNFDKTGVIKLQLQERDKHILEEISIETSSDMPLYFTPLYEKNHNWSNTYTLTFRSRHMSDVLKSYGMVPRKSLVLEFPHWMSCDLYSHFLRGYMDGDGSISVNTQGISRVSMVGTTMFLYTVKDICTNLGIKSSIRLKNDSDVVATLYITSASGRISFLNYIYQGAGLKLNRKYNKYQQILEQHNINNSLVS